MEADSGHLSHGQERRGQGAERACRETGKEAVIARDMVVS